jgi:hypothetical protein
VRGHVAKCLRDRKRQELMLTEKSVLIYVISPYKNCFQDKATNKIMEDLLFCKRSLPRFETLPDT